MVGGQRVVITNFEDVQAPARGVGPDGQPRELKTDADGRLETTRRALAGFTSDVHAPAANTAAVVTYPAIPWAIHVIGGVAWGYSGGDPTGGSIKVEDGSGNVIFGPIPITAAGAGAFYFPMTKRNAAVNRALIITLAAGGGGITGVLSIIDHGTV